MERIENRTFDEIKPGDTASLVRTLTHKDIELFAIMSGDVKPRSDGTAKQWCDIVARFPKQLSHP